MKTSRFDARVSQEQKDLFEFAAQLGGFRNLTDFVIYTVQEKANDIIKDHETILASQRDKEIFFNALLNPPAANQALKTAAEKYKRRYVNP
ncbi:MAG: DUF1778 domain-containing protein [Bacteroidia bacterium]|nr:DUF1778 domain-containing protein [Bacteroidia bacterium]